MKYLRIIWAAFILCLLLCVPVVAATAGFNAGLTIDRTTEESGSFSVTVVADDTNNALLAENQPTLSVPCAYTYAQVVGPNGDTACSVTDGVVSFTVATGGTYTVQQLFAVTFDANGGTCSIISAPCDATGKLSTLPTPTRGGYWEFIGWYAATSGGARVTSETTFPTDTTIYAQWYYDAPYYPPSPSVPVTPPTTTETTENEDGSITITLTNTKTGTVTETTENTDGTTTTVETRKDGTITEKVENPDGSSITTETKPDGSSTKTTVFSDGTIGTAVADETGKINASVVISEEASSSQKPVSLPIPPVSANTNSDAAAAITITTNSEKNTSVAIPMIKVSASTVAVIVNEDGTESVIPETKMTDENLIIDVSNGAIVKIMDIASNFEDVADHHWENEAINYASARGLVNGVGNNLFDKDGVATRAHVVTLLARLAGVNTTPDEGQNWYDKGHEWAVANGITYEGSMNIAVSRQSMFTMMWRLLGTPKSDQDISHFTDTDDLTQHTEDAARWAVEIGLVQGHGDGTMDPNGTVTRGQLAQFLMNFIQLT